MSELVVMPKADWQAALEATRAKTGKSDKIKSGELAAEITGISSGGSGDKPFDCRSVTFMQDDTVLYIRSVGDGDTCANPVSRGLIEAPIKESTAQYDFPHTGWSLTNGGGASTSALTNVTEDRTVYAAFGQSTRHYAINFYDDNDTLLSAQSLAYGAMPTYTPEEKIGYIFMGWQPEVSTVTNAVDYHAVWQSTADLPNGTCGDGVNWIIMPGGALHITGEGTMGPFNYPNYAPWREYASSITSMHVGDGVTNLAAYACMDCSNMKEITLADSVTTLGGFSGASGVTSIDLPSNITSLTNGFGGLSSIKVLDLGTSLNTTLPMSAFGSIPSVIIRNTTMIPQPTTSADMSYVFGSTTQYLYVPSALVSTWKSSRYMSKYHKNQVRAIEDYPDICG